MKEIKNWSMTFMIVGLAAAPAWADQAQTQPGSSQTRTAPQSQQAIPPAAAPVFDPSKSDEKALAIAEKVMASMGGDAWAKARFIKFTFLVKKGETRATTRTHYWDRFSQRSRMEGPSKEGKPVVAIVDHRSREGQATLDGQLLFDADAKKYTDIAYGMLINDSYWLFMPFKLKDPGVRLRYEGEVTAGPVTYDKILVSFDGGIGLTPADRYWLYVNRADNMIERWSYVLQGMGANTPPTAWQWVDWFDIGGMKLSLRKTQPEGEVEIRLEDVQVFDSLADTVFTGTGPVDAAAPPSQPATQPSGQ